MPDSQTQSRYPRGINIVFIAAVASGFRIGVKALDCFANRRLVIGRKRGRTVPQNDFTAVTVAIIQIVGTDGPVCNPQGFEIVNNTGQTENKTVKFFFINAELSMDLR